MTNVEHHETWLTELQKGSYALISDSEAVDTAVIFVHGFLGGPEGTWLNFQEDICSGTSKRKEWASCDVYFFAYRSFLDDITESAGDLLTFILKIFPKPPSWIFQIPKRVPRLPDTLLDLSSTMPSYQRLVLVGHSEGGLVIRRTIDIAFGKKIGSIRDSKLALFAPAHKGVKLSGWFGACLAVGRVDAILMPFLNLSPAFVEMKQDKLTEEVQEHMQDYRNESKPDPPESLMAHVLFGKKDHVVQKGFYSWDCFHDSEPGKDHISICKPTTGYDRPITFVLERIQGVRKCTDSNSS